MATISTGSHPKALWPGIHEWWGRSYQSEGELCKDLFDFRSSSQAYEELVEATGFSIAGIKAEGASVDFVTEQQGTVTRATHVAYGQGYIVTKEEQDDNLYTVVSMRRAEANAFAMRTTRETVAANQYNNGFDSNFTFGDGSAMLVTNHPSLSGDQSNILSTAADLTEASLEDTMINVRNAVNSKGLRIALTAQTLHVAPANMFNAHRILKSTLRVETANNDPNALKDMGYLGGGVKVNPFLSDADAWFVRTNCPAGLILFERKPIEFSTDNDFNTDNLKAKAYMRFSLTIGDWRAIYGSPGV